MSARDQVFEILRKAFQIEVDGHVFYTMAAEKSRSGPVRELFAKLAGDEKLHQQYLKDIIRFYDAQGVATFAVPLRTPEMLALSQRVLPQRLGVQAADAELEGAVLSIGIQLESNAIACYSDAATGATEAEVRGFYRFLADWESQHLIALQGLLATLRGEPGERPGSIPL